MAGAGRGPEQAIGRQRRRQRREEIEAAILGLDACAPFCRCRRACAMPAQIASARRGRVPPWGGGPRREPARRTGVLGSAEMRVQIPRNRLRNYPWSQPRCAAYMEKKGEKHMRSPPGPSSPAEAPASNGLDCRGTGENETRLASFRSREDTGGWHLPLLPCILNRPIIDMG